MFFFLLNISLKSLDRVLIQNLIKSGFMVLPQILFQKLTIFSPRETRRNVLERLLSVSTAQNPEIFLRLTKCDAIINIDRFFFELKFEQP